MKLRYWLIVGVLATLPMASAVAQEEDGSEVVLPLEAQNCVLPVAPSRIPDEATYDDLVKAKGNIAGFQEQLMTYRACLDDSADVAELTDGNQAALTSAHNYSVEMEERVAEQFNVAVRDYKARQAESGN